MKRIGGIPWTVIYTNSIELIPNASWQQLRDYYLISGIQKTTGLEVAISKIYEMKKANVISEQQLYNYLRLIRSAFTNIGIAKQVDLLNELEQKILVPVVER